MRQAGRRITQRDIARLAGVSQAAVSAVVTGRMQGSVRIPEETQTRIRQVIEETGYVADPAARTLTQNWNRILGVFTFESVFPNESADFYHPFLLGIEQSAEQYRQDLLLFTSTPQEQETRRRSLGRDSRLRLADGCILLGRQISRDELANLNAREYPFVVIGRREHAGGLVPFVGADYAHATESALQRAEALGHHRFVYLCRPSAVESSVDRRKGVTMFAERAGMEVIDVRADSTPPEDVALMMMRQGFTALVAEEGADAVEFVVAARNVGIDVPEQISVVSLGDPTRPAAAKIDVSGFHVPRVAMGRLAVTVLVAQIRADDTVAPQQLVTCEEAAGSTLAPPRPAQSRMSGAQSQ